jgi:DNA-binding transcriptional LysR family regulator
MAFRQVWNMLRKTFTLERNSAMSQVPEMRVVVAVLELCSFTAAGARFGLTGSATAKLVGRVEERLGATLVTRSTRRLTLTPEGEFYLGRVRRILADIEETEEEISSSRSSPIGPLRVTCPNFIFLRLLAPVLPEFLERFPKVQVDLVVTDRRLDIVSDGIDVAIRLGALADSTLHVRKLCDMYRNLYASPRYIERQGMPVRPEDLAQHECLFSNQVPGLDVWAFRGKRSVRHIKVSSRLQLNDAVSVYEATLAGLGIAQFSDLLAGQARRSGSLVPVLDREWHKQPIALSLVMPPGRQRAARVSAFISFCVERFGHAPWRSEASSHGLADST